MRRFLLCLLLTVTASSLVSAQAPASRTISLSQLRDKIAGGWAGQMIGVSYGAPTEFRYKEEIIPMEKLPVWKPEMVTNSLNQDDLYVDMTFAKVLDVKGLNATTADFGAMFRDAKYNLWHANLASRRALKRGVAAELAGTPKYNAHANDIDFQIEADFIGLMAPGLPRSSNDIALRAGRVMNYGDGIYGGMFVSCMYAAAFFENDPHKIVRAGLDCIPSKSPYALLISDLLTWHDAQPGNWEAVWKKVESKWNKREPCPDGAGHPFNIDAKLNGAYIALGLLYGDGSMSKTIEISTRAGQDSDCNPSSAAGVLGVVLGYSRIPDEWKSGIPAIEDRKFSYTDFTFKTIVESTYQRALALVRQTGGSVNGETLTVKLQKPAAPRLEVWDNYGEPVERVPLTNARWKFNGAWREDKGTRYSVEKGAEASVIFDGTGAILVGPYIPNGGKAEVYLDGKLDRRVDVYPDENSRKSSEAVWHAFNLANGSHTVRIVVLAEPAAGSSGMEVGLTDIVVFR